MRYSVKLFVLFTLLSCSSVRVNYDYEEAADFSNYHTYNYYSDMNTGLSELDTRRLLTSLDGQMKLKGIRFSEDPDFLINIESRLIPSPNSTSIGLGVGGTGRNVGGGISVGIPVGQSNIERQIFFDLIDSHSNALFWQAVSEDSFKENISPEKREEHLQALVAKVFSKYPPK
ncbi:DUF4136 domain-containing protein [Pareuzebyella sediminis]|uniref:DUF4136 domain-containing protein n=1 Tax=Pareuzebyella sediminis TaxID=2607998 RepID=UPI0011EC6306|nr:DUF4136 domain-containing protein [Pareuzebyella sediminis]